MSAECQHERRTVYGRLKREQVWHCPDCGASADVDDRPRCAHCGLVCWNSFTLLYIGKLTLRLHGEGRSQYDDQTCAWYVRHLAGVEVVYDPEDDAVYRPWSTQGRGVIALRMT